MSIPVRNADGLRVIAGERTFFVTSSTRRKSSILQSDRAARLLIDVLYHYRHERRYLLHEFVIMPDHLHVLITLGADMTVEKAVQLIKGILRFERDANWGSGPRSGRRGFRKFGSMRRRR